MTVLRTGWFLAAAAGFEAFAWIPAFAGMTDWWNVGAIEMGAYAIFARMDRGKGQGVKSTKGRLRRPQLPRTQRTSRELPMP